MTIFSRDLRLEHQIGNNLMLALLFCIAQLGGIPTPKSDSQLALGLWYVWIVAVWLQVLSVFFAIIMVCEAFIMLSVASRPCMVPVVSAQM